jgi:phosphoribosylaminoimidazole-succinocarboxamide synthase
MAEERKKLAEGKTKIIWQEPGDASARTVLVESKDDITAGDGAKHDILDGKAVAATATTCNVFELLNANGALTHYIERVNSRTFRAYNAVMIPIELVVRRVATGSYLKRNPQAVEGEMFDELVFEMFHKDDAAHDPIMRFEFDRDVAVRYPAGEPQGAEPIDEVDFRSLRLGVDAEEVVGKLRDMALEVFTILESAWAEQDIQLVDLKIECGWVLSGSSTGLAVADVIDNDSWRIWPAGDRKRMLDKQVYRNLAGTDDAAAKAKELGKIKSNYARVAEMTGKFIG